MRFLSAMLLGAVVAMPVQAQGTDDEIAIRVTVGEKFRGHATNDSTTMRRPFLPTAHIEGVRNDTLVSWTLDHYLSSSRGISTSDEAMRRRYIDWIGINGTAGMAQATLEHGLTTFTGFFALLKENCKRRIANTVYAAMQRTPRHDATDAERRPDQARAPFCMPASIRRVAV